MPDGMPHEVVMNARGIVAKEAEPASDRKHSHRDSCDDSSTHSCTWFQLDVRVDCSVVDDLIAMNFELITDAHEDPAHWVKLVSSVGLNEIFGDKQPDARPREIPPSPRNCVRVRRSSSNGFNRQLLIVFPDDRGAEHEITDWALDAPRRPDCCLPSREGKGRSPRDYRFRRVPSR